MRHKDALLSIGGPTCSAAGPVKAHQVPCSAVRLKLGASNCPQPRCAPLKKTSVLAAKSCPSQNSLKFLATVVQHHRTARICQRILKSSMNAAPLLMSAVPMLPPHVWDQLTGNYVFMVGFWGWFLAQFLKIFTKWYKTGIFSLKAFIDSGGMPSSHSALCSAVTTAVALKYGFGSSLFAICTCFSVIVMYDAMGVRRHAGLQAEVLNAVVEDLLEHHPVSERKLKEVLGHTPRQVLCGAILGVLVGLSYPKPF